MRIGVSLPNVGLDHGKEMLLPVAEAAERLGFDSVWAAHHVVLPYERDEPVPVPALRHRGRDVARACSGSTRSSRSSIVAGVTDRIGLGTSVLVLPYRNPVNLAAEAAALDVLSDGRLILGVGRGLDARGVRGARDRSGERGRAHRRVHPGAAGALDRGPRELRRALRRLRRHRARDHAAHRGRAADLGRRQHRRRAPPRAAATATAGTGSRSSPRRCRSCASGSTRLGEEVGRDPAELELSVARGLIPPGREEESFVPDRRMLGGSADAIVEELGELRGAGRRAGADPGEPARPARSGGARVGRGRGASAASVAARAVDRLRAPHGRLLRPGHPSRRSGRWGSPSLGLARPDFPPSGPGGRLLVGVTALIVAGALIALLATPQGASARGGGREGRRAEARSSRGEPAPRPPTPPSRRPPPAQARQDREGDREGVLDRARRRHTLRRAGTRSRSRTGKIQHDLAIEGTGKQTKTPLLDAGKSKDLAVNLKAGKYKFYCTVPGHEQAGMKVEVTVK